MRLWFKERFFTWLDAYDVYDADGRVVYTVQGALSWGHCLHILDAAGNHVGTVKERILTFLPQFELYLGENYLGRIRKEFTLFHTKYDIDCNGWQMEGDFFEWNYAITDDAGRPLAQVGKELLHWMDTYVIDVADPRDALCTLMLVLAIDAEKCSRS